MLRRRPAVAVCFGVANIVAGALGLFVYTCSGFGIMALLAEHALPALDYVAGTVRLFVPLAVAHVAVSLILCVLLIVVGVGLLRVQNWGRLGSLTCAGLALLLNVGTFVFQMAVVDPALQVYVDSAMHPVERIQNAGEAVFLSYVVYTLSSTACLYFVILCVMLLLPDVAAAFRDQPAPAWAQDLDDFDDDRPRRRRRPRHDDGDD